MDVSSRTEWSNWSGSIKFRPRTVESPANETELAGIIRAAVTERRSIRAVGARHSCSPIFETRDILLSMEKFKTFYGADPGKSLATVGAGMTVEEVGNAMHTVNMAMENTGHINKQAIGGAISTGTHGAGKKLSNLSGQVTGVRLIDGNGAVKEYSQDNDPEMMSALRVSLGSMGIFTQITLKSLPAFSLHRRQYCASTEDCLSFLDQLMEENRNFCFYWYPRRDDVSIRLWNAPGTGMLRLPFKATLYKECTGWSKDVLPTEHELKYNELEYSIDLDKAPACFAEIRDRIKLKHRRTVGWRILYRPIAGDENYLSNSYGGSKVAITIHQNASLPYQQYFDDIERIFQSYGGRPHWGKKHSMDAQGLQKLYPMWQRFIQIREQMDPNGIFLNDYLRKVITG